MASNVAGLSATRKRRLVRALGASHHLRIKLLLLDFNHNIKGDLSHFKIGGQVDFQADKKGGWDRYSSALLEIFDPRFELGFDSSRPGEGQLFADRMVQVIYCVHVEEEPDPDRRWYEIPVFTGPIASAKRNGRSISLVCEGKEYLAKRGAYTAKTYKKGWKRTYMIRDLIIRWTGENPEFVSIPQQRAELTRNYTLAVNDKTYWDRAVSAGKALRKHLLYDARGILRLEYPSENITYGFRDGSTETTDRPATIVGDVTTSFDTENIYNIVKVTGREKPKGRPAAATVWAPPGHPVNAHIMGRNGAPRHRVYEIKDADVDTDREAEELAQETMDSLLRSYVDAEFKCLPNPMLHGWQVCSLYTRYVVLPTFRITQATLPLDGTLMTVGARGVVRAKRRGARQWQR